MELDNTSKHVSFPINIKTKDFKIPDAQEYVCPGPITHKLLLPTSMTWSWQLHKMGKRTSMIWSWQLHKIGKR